MMADEARKSSERGQKQGVSEHGDILNEQRGNKEREPPPPGGRVDLAGAVGPATNGGLGNGGFWQLGFRFGGMAVGGVRQLATVAGVGFARTPSEPRGKAVRKP